MVGGIPFDDFAALAKHELNGRQIRNLTRLAKMLNPGCDLTVDGMSETFRFGGVSKVCGHCATKEKEGMKEDPCHAP